MTCANCEGPAEDSIGVNSKGEPLCERCVLAMEDLRIWEAEEPARELAYVQRLEDNIERIFACRENAPRVEVAS